MTSTSDVAIIGGGIVGVAAAADLAAAGARVTLFERGADVAAAASGRNAGLILRPPDPVMGDLYDGTLAMYRAVEGREVEPGRTFGLPDSPIRMLGLSADVDLMRRLAASAGTELIDGPALRALEPMVAPDLVGVTISTGYAARPADATRTFAALARERGAAIRVGAAARPWVEGGVARGVEVDGSRFEAGAVLVAAGWWTSELVDPSGAWRPVQALWGLLVEMELPAPPRNVLEEIKAEDSMHMSDPGEAPLFTFNPPPRLPSGAPALNPAIGNTLAATEPDPARLAPVLLRHAQRFLPSLDERQVRGVRVCPRPGSADGRPLVGHVPGIEGLVVAAGNGAWGISTGPATARLAAEAIRAGSDAGVPPELLARRFGAPAGR